MSRLKFLTSRRVKAAATVAALLFAGILIAPEGAKAAPATEVRFQSEEEPVTPVSQNSSSKFTVEAVDGLGDIDGAWAGSVGFEAFEEGDEDPCTTECFTITPNNGGPSSFNQYTFTGADDGEKEFTITWKKAGDFDLVLSSTIEADEDDTVAIEVVGQGATEVAFDGEDGLEVDTTPYVGVPDAVQVSLLNDLGDVDKSYALQVTFANSTCGSDFRIDPHIGDSPLGKNYVFQPADQGRKTFNVTWLDDDPSSCKLNVTANIPTSEDQVEDEVTGINPEVAPATTTTTGPTTTTAPTTTTTVAPPAHDPLIVTGQLQGGAPAVKAVKASDGTVVRSFNAYEAGFTGGVEVAFGDVNNDGYKDIVTAAGPGGGPHVKVFSGKDGTLLKRFYAYAPGLASGINVAVGDVNGDGKADIITGPNVQQGFGPHVKAFSGNLGSADNFDAPTLVASFFAYNEGFNGGVRVAAADLDNDGKADIVTAAGPGGGPHVRAFKSTGTPQDGPFVMINQFAYAENFTGGVFVAASKAGDIARVVTGAGPGGGMHIRILNESGVVASQFIVPNSGTQGARVALGQLDSDEADELAVANASGSSVVRKYNLPNAQIGDNTESFGGFPNGVSVAIGQI